MSQSKQISFSRKPNYRRDLPKIKSAIQKTFPVLESPSKMNPKTRVDYFVFNQLRDRLANVRLYLDKAAREKNAMKYFCNLFCLTKSYRVANCCEMAEISKTALKLNGVKNCDIYSVYAQKADGSGVPRCLDHAIAAVNVPRSKNNKNTLALFEPALTTKIVDFWLDIRLETIRGFKKKAAALGLKSDEKILLKPIRTLEPDKKVLESVKKRFPSLVVKKEKTV